MNIFGRHLSPYGNKTFVTPHGVFGENAWPKERSRDDYKAA